MKPHVKVALETEGEMLWKLNLSWKLWGLKI